MAKNITEALLQQNAGALANSPWLRAIFGDQANKGQDTPDPEWMMSEDEWLNYMDKATQYYVDKRSIQGELQQRKKVADMRDAGQRNPSAQAAVPEDMQPLMGITHTARPDGVYAVADTPPWNRPVQVSYGNMDEVRALMNRGAAFDQRLKDDPSLRPTPGALQRMSQPDLTSGNGRMPGLTNDELKAIDERARTKEAVKATVDYYGSGKRRPAMEGGMPKVEFQGPLSEYVKAVRAKMDAITNGVGDSVPEPGAYRGSPGRTVTQEDLDKREEYRGRIAKAQEKRQERVTANAQMRNNPVLWAFNNGGDGSFLSDAALHGPQVALQLQALRSAKEEGNLNREADIKKAELLAGAKQDLANSPAVIKFRAAMDAAGRMPTGAEKTGLYLKAQRDLDAALSAMNNPAAGPPTPPKSNDFIQQTASSRGLEDLQIAFGEAGGAFRALGLENEKDRTVPKALDALVRLEREGATFASDDADKLRAWIRETIKQRKFNKAGLHKYNQSALDALLNGGSVAAAYDSAYQEAVDRERKNKPKQVSDTLRLYEHPF